MAETIHVVAAIIERNGRVFCAQRGCGALAGGWEFPGGKVEPGETAESALRREVREELGCKLSTMWYLDTVDYDYPDFHLHMDCYVATLADGEEPQSLEHRDTRWMGRDDLMSVEWLPADRGLVMGLGIAWEEIFSVAHL